MLQIITAIAGASAFLGLLALLGYTYLTLRTKQLKKSIREVVDGDAALFNAKQIVEIIKTFDGDEARLQALSQITNHDAHRAKDLLEHFGKGAKLEDLSDFANKETRRNRLGGAALFLIVIAIIAYLGRPSAAPSTPDEKRISSPSPVSQCDSAPPQSPASADAINSALDNHQAAYALSEAERYVKNFPSDPTAYRLKGIAHYRLEQYDPAVRAYDEALRLCPQDARTLFNKAAALSELGDLDSAGNIYEQLVNSNPNDLDTRLGLAFVQLRAGQYESAQRNYHRVSIHPDGKGLLPSSNIGMAVALLLTRPTTKERVAEAMKYLVTAICLQRDFEEVLLGRKTEIQSLSYKQFGPLLKSISLKKIPEYDRLMRRIRERKLECK